MLQNNVERIGQFSIVTLRRNAMVALLDRDNGELEYYQTRRDAREAALERADLVTVFEAVN